MLDCKCFENEFSKVFNGVSRNTLSAHKNKLRYTLAGEIETSDERAHKALTKGQKILSFCFKDIPFWLRIILWDNKAKEGLFTSGLTLNKTDQWFEGIYNGENILYLYYAKFDPELINPVIKAIVNNDLGIDPCSNITCYFINFDVQLIANIYDDRGIDVLTFDEGFYMNLKRQKF